MLPVGSTNRDTTVKPKVASARHLATIDPAAWFHAAVARAPSPRAVWAGGLRLHVAAWNDRDIGKPPLLLVHGFRAHAHWWDHIAPSLLLTRRVYALDLSGMGHSARRQAYTRQGFTDDILSVARWLKDRAPRQPLSVVGHSYGGSRLLDACAQVPGLIDQAIVLDAPLPAAAALERTGRASQRTAPDSDRAAILARFRLSPEQPAWPCIRSYIAERSIVANEDGGWRWCFDPAVMSVIGGAPAQDEVLRRVTARVDIVRGERSSIVDAGMADRMASLLPHLRGSYVLPGAHHHLMLDQPQALVGLLQSLLDEPAAPAPDTTQMPTR